MEDIERKCDAAACESFQSVLIVKFIGITLFGFVLICINIYREKERVAKYVL